MSSEATWNAIAIDASDNVAVALSHLHKGDGVRVQVGGVVRLFPAADDVPLGHKIALVAMKKGVPVIKYGAVIASTTRDIAPGCHVHIHNIASTRAGKVAR